MTISESAQNQEKLVWSKNDGIQCLMDLGLSRVQANIYLALTLHGEADARLIATLTSAPRTEVYRTLSELQGLSLVDKKIGLPLKFIAVPPSIGLQSLIERKSCEIKRMEEKAKEFTSEFERIIEQEDTQEYRILIIDGRKRILSEIKRQHDRAKFDVDIISFLPRFLLIGNECRDNYRRAVERGVKFRIIIGLPNGKKKLPRSIQQSHKNDNTVIKTIIGNPKINYSTFDQEQTSFSFFPDKLITDSPLVLTNHPSLVALAHDSFERMWDSL